MAHTLGVNGAIEKCTMWRQIKWRHFYIMAPYLNGAYASCKWRHLIWRHFEWRHFKWRHFKMAPFYMAVPQLRVFLPKNFQKSLKIVIFQPNDHCFHIKQHVWLVKHFLDISAGGNDLLSCYTYFGHI